MRTRRKKRGRQPVQLSSTAMIIRHPCRRGRRATSEAVQTKVVAEGPAPSVQDSEESDLGTQVGRDRRRSPMVRAAVRNSTRAVRSEIPGLADFGDR